MAGTKLTTASSSAFRVVYCYQTLPTLTTLPYLITLPYLPTLGTYDMIIQFEDSRVHVVPDALTANTLNCKPVTSDSQVSSILRKSDPGRHFSSNPVPIRFQSDEWMIRPGPVNTETRNSKEATRVLFVSTVKKGKGGVSDFVCQGGRGA